MQRKMKVFPLLILAIILTFTLKLSAQVSINTDGTDPDGSAMLDVKSTDKGILLPRLTTAQRTGITNPATGLLVFDNETNSFWFYDGANWTELRHGSIASLQDADNDTKIQVEESTDEDKIRFDIAGAEALRIEAAYESTSGLNVNTFSETPVFLTQSISNFSVWQSFIATSTGKMEAAHLKFSGSSETGVNFYTIKIYTGQGTGGQLLASIPITAPVNGSWVSIPVPGDIELTNGATYSLWISKLYGIGQRHGNPYADGVSSWDPDRDLALMVYTFEKTTQTTVEGILNVNEAFNFPLTDGASNNALVTDGAGNLSWGDLSAYLDNTDTQDLSLQNDILSLTNGGSVDLSPYLDADNLGNHTATQNLNLNGNWLSGDGTNEGIEVSATGAAHILTDRLTSLTEADLEVEYGDSPMLRLHQNTSKGYSAINWDLAGNDVNFFIREYGSPSKIPFLIQAGAPDNSMKIMSSGNVGIGISSSPAQKLSVAGTVECTSGGFKYPDGTLQTTAYTGGDNLGNHNATQSIQVFNHAITFTDAQNSNAVLQITGNDTGGSNPGLTVRAVATPAGNSIFTVQDQSYQTMMQVKDNGNLIATGNVGIGITNPTKAKVEISGSQSTSLSYGYLNSIGTTGTSSGVNGYSLYANGRIAGSEFNAFSDVRIKTILGRSNREQDLSTLMGIEITDYTLIDTLAKGTHCYKKVIAQQVEEVFPQAVSTITDVVPDIYQRADMKDGWVQLATDLRPGERVKIITEQSTAIYEVTAVEAHQFKVNQLPIGDYQPTSVFVYGREVDDFHTVDYEAIAMLNVSATQEQQRIIQAQQSRIEELEAQVSKIDHLEAIVQQLQHTLHADRLELNSSSLAKAPQDHVKK